MFRVGVIVCHRITREEGRILRVVKTSDIVPVNSLHQQSDSTAYVVSIRADAFRPSREALWYASELIGYQPLEGNASVEGIADKTEGQERCEEMDLPIKVADESKLPDPEI